MTESPTTEDLKDDPDHDIDAVPTGSRKVAEARAAVRQIRVPYEPQQLMQVAIDETLYSAKRLHGQPMPTAKILADSFSGKSAGAIAAIGIINERGEHQAGEIPVAYVKLDTDGTVGSTATDILRGLSVERPDRGTPSARWERVRRELHRRQTHVIVLDEFQRSGRRPTVSPAIAGKIMDLVEDGLCAVVFLGKKDAVNVFKLVPDLLNRMDAPVMMPKLKWAIDDDKRMFLKFAKDFDAALVERNVLSRSARLGDEKIAELLLESADGLIGRFCRIVENAVMNVVREGHTVIVRADLATAVDEYAIDNRLIEYNPFEGKG